LDHWAAGIEGIGAAIFLCCWTRGSQS